MSRQTFLSIGECMVEMAALEDGNFRLGFAGDTMNTAWYARSTMPADTWNVAYFTRLGEDTYSLKMRAFFETNGIDTSLIGVEKDRRPGLYMIEITDGERNFTYWRDQSAAKCLAADRESLSDALSQADFIYFSGITIAILSPEDRTVLLEEIAKARKAGRRVAFDPNLRPRLWTSTEEMRVATMEAAAVADIVLPSFDDEAAVFGDADLEACARRYLTAGANLTVVKNGGGPMLIADGLTLHHIDGVERVKPVDTTGAGDSFNGGFLASLALGASPRDAVAAGHRVSLQVIMHRGALMPMGTLRT
jgi:2-dehydro-3-deoxygluconokinase